MALKEPGETYTHPARPNLPPWVIPRPRLIQRLCRGVQGPVTVVVGPPGAGKTTLVRAWAETARQDSSHRVAWLTCDPKPSEETFWPALARALNLTVPTGPGFGAKPLENELATELAHRPEPLVFA